MRWFSCFIDLNKYICMYVYIYMYEQPFFSDMLLVLLLGVQEALDQPKPEEEPRPKKALNISGLWGCEAPRSLGRIASPWRP